MSRRYFVAISVSQRHSRRKVFRGICLHICDERRRLQAQAASVCGRIFALVVTRRQEDSLLRRWVYLRDECRRLRYICGDDRMLLRFPCVVARRQQNNLRGAGRRQQYLCPERLWRGGGYKSATESY